jgi:hypothetical protein
MILILFLGLELLIGGCQRTFAGNDPGLLEKQTIHLFQQGKYQEAIAAAEKLLASREKELGPEDPKTVLERYSAALFFLLADFRNPNSARTPECPVRGSRTRSA